MNFRNMGSTDERDVRHPPPAAAAAGLVRQPSVYSLTFDEFHSTMGGFGKDFGSMNMDEFLKNIWTAEESQAMAAGNAAGVAGTSGGGLQRQGSLMLPRTLSQKTVDEVWRDLVAVQGGAGGGGGAFCQQRQPTLGEMTLEEFLVQAGVVREDMDQSVNQQQQIPRPIDGITAGNSNNTSSIFYPGMPASNSNQGIVLGFGQSGRSSGAVVQSQIPNCSAASLAMGGGSSRPYQATLTLGNAADMASPQRMRGGGVMGIGDPTMHTGLMQGMVGLGGGGVTVAATASPANQMSSDGLAKGNGDLSSLSPIPYAFNGGIRGKKSSGTVEKVVERRQRRMIKNRESAARSRARKQAYTMELEAEIAKLKELNEELQKKQSYKIHALLASPFHGEIYMLTLLPESMKDRTDALKFPMVSDASLRCSLPASNVGFRSWSPHPYHFCSFYFHCSF